MREHRPWTGSAVHAAVHAAMHTPKHASLGPVRMAEKPQDTRRHHRVRRDTNLCAGHILRHGVPHQQTA